MRIIHVPPSKSGDFATILETLEHAPDFESVPTRRGPGGHVRPEDTQGKDWLLQLLDTLSPPGEAAHAEERAASLYVEEMVEPAPPAPRPSLPEDQASVAAELALRADMSEEELRHVRRAFALDNHPDRLLPEERLCATRRMTIANMLIDQHLKRKANAH